MTTKFKILTDITPLDTDCEKFIKQLNHAAYQNSYNKTWLKELMDIESIKEEKAVEELRKIVKKSGITNPRDIYNKYIAIYFEQKFRYKHRIMDYYFVEALTNCVKNNKVEYPGWASYFQEALFSTLVETDKENILWYKKGYDIKFNAITKNNIKIINIENNITKALYIKHIGTDKLAKQYLDIYFKNKAFNNAFYFLNKSNYKIESTDKLKELILTAFENNSNNFLSGFNIEDKDIIVQIPKKESLEDRVTRQLNDCSILNSDENYQAAKVILENILTDINNIAKAFFDGDIETTEENILEAFSKGIDDFQKPYLYAQSIDYLNI